MILGVQHFDKERDIYIYNGNGIDEIDGISDEIYEIDASKFIFYKFIVKDHIQFCFRFKEIEFVNPTFNNFVSFLGNNNKFVFNELVFSGQKNNIYIFECNSTVEYNHKLIGKDNTVDIFHIYCKDLTINFSNIKALIVFNVVILNEFTVKGSSPTHCEIGRILIKESYINSLHFNSFRFEFPNFTDTLLENFIISGVVYNRTIFSENIILPICKTYVIYDIDIKQKKLYISFDRQSNNSVEITSFTIKNIRAKLIEIEQNKLDSYRLFISNSNSQVRFLASDKSEEPFIQIKNLKLIGEVSIFQYLKNVKVHNLELNGFNPSEKFIFDNIKDKSVISGDFIVNDSNLNNVVFKPSILHLFKRIYIISSSIQNLKLIGFKYIEPLRIKDKHNGIDCDRIETFRYLKNTSDLNKDLNSYLNYKAAEFDETLKKDRNLNWGEKLTLCLNKFTNRHSTDWRYALGEIFVLIGLYIGILYIVLDLKSFNPLVLNHFDYLLFPFNFLINIKEKLRFPDWLPYVDFFYNFVLSFLIYQMIAAFRKFNR